MIAELGVFALVLALLVAAVQAIFPLLGAQLGIAAWVRLARPAAVLQCALSLLSTGVLVWCFWVGDYSVLYVAGNSHQDLPAIYKLTAFWGGHEGSMLLWQLLLACWSVAVAWRSQALPEAFVARVLAVLGWISVGLLAFLLFLSNPFLRLVPAALEGRDLNPLLQDPGMVFHPPLLYMGYVGFAVPFAFALAALISGELGAAWARWSRSWTLAAWAFLTLGILLGSAWAYYVLGWGGLVVLGSCGERFLHAMAGWHGLAALSDCHGPARGISQLVGFAGHLRVFAVAARDLSCALRGADIGACICG